MERGYERLLAELKEHCPATRVYVQSVLPLRGRWAGHNERVLEVNAGLKGMADRHGHVYLDIHQFLRDERGELKEKLTGDGLHLNSAGYLEWIRHLPEDPTGDRNEPHPRASPSSYRAAPRGPTCPSWQWMASSARFQRGGPPPPRSG